MKRCCRTRRGGLKTAFKLAVGAAALYRAGQIGYGLYRGYRILKKPK
jgi:hypothetical protein